MTKKYRQGGLGALMDEYERAIVELSNLLNTLYEDRFIHKHPEVPERFCSVQLIMRHVLVAAYGYASDIRNAFDMPIIVVHLSDLERHHQFIESLSTVVAFTAMSLEGRWTMTDKEIEKITVMTSWGTRYTLEQMLEHAIVHILRHRRQIERLLGK